MRPLRTLAAATVLACAAAPAPAIGPESPIPTGMSAGGAEWPTPEPASNAAPGTDRPAAAPGDGTRGDGRWAAGRPTFTLDFLSPADPESAAAPTLRDADRADAPGDVQIARP